jgi:predicted Zn-dependent protease
MLASNPSLLSKIINPGKNESSQFMTPQELNIEKQREELRKREAESKQKMQQQQMSQQVYIEQLQNQIKQQNEMLSKKSEPSSYGAGFGNFSVGEPQPANSKMSGLPKQIPSNQLRPNIPDIRAPEQVKNILDRLHNINPSNRPTNTDTQDESSSNNDRIIEESTVSESNSNKRKQMKKVKKSNISIF